MLLSIITINYGYDSGLLKTINTVDAQNETDYYEHILVISAVNESEKNLLKRQYSSKNRIFIFNRDKSLYNAMNIGLQSANGEYVLFMNGGDEMYGKDVMEYIYLKCSGGDKVCYAFQTLQMWGDACYLRPGNGNLKKLMYDPAHQGFLCPRSHDNIYFDEDKSIVADLLWMRKNIERYGVVVCGEILSVVHLGGMSNYSTLKTIRMRYESQGFLSMITELLKYIIRKIFGDDLYYAIMAKKSRYEFVRFEKYKTDGYKF